MRDSDANRIAAGGALAILLVALGGAVALGLRHDSTAPVASPPASTTPHRTAKPRPQSQSQPARQARFVKLTAAGAYDPEGDGHERDEEAPLAVDGQEGTFWRTERYSRFFKTGVGLVLDAGRRVRVTQVVVDTATPGVRAEIRLGSTPEGPFARASASKALTARTVFPVAKRVGRYVVVWITALPTDSAGEISEVRLRAA